MTARHWTGDQDDPGRYDWDARRDDVRWPPVVGDQVTLLHEGRFLLGDVTGIVLAPAGTFLLVRHFNGDPWPLAPAEAAVSIIPREYTND